MEIGAEDLAAVETRVGTVVSAAPNQGARKPALLLEIDFGPHGRRTSSAQLAADYAPEELVGRQVVAVCNLPPRRVAGVRSEVLVLAAVEEGGSLSLLAPDRPVPNGTRVA